MNGLQISAIAEKLQIHKTKSNLEPPDGCLNVRIVEETTSSDVLKP